jgi:protein TonB
VVFESPEIRTRLIFDPAGFQVRGGGGGGQPAPAPAPARAIEVPPHALPPPVPIQAPLVDVPPPLTSIDVSFETPLSTVLLGAGTSLASISDFGGRGRGAGPGEGDGVRLGRGGLDGGGPRMVGGGVTAPTLLREVEPFYTADAMRSKIQGEVHIQAVVRADGTVGDMTITKSLDRLRGLDEAALRAASQWRFRPATLEGRPVDVYVTLVLEFRLR